MSSGASVDFGKKKSWKKKQQQQQKQYVWGIAGTQMKTNLVGLVPLYLSSSPLGWKARRQKPSVIFVCNCFQDHNYKAIEWKLMVQIPQGHGFICCQFELEGWILVEVMAFFWAKSRIFTKGVFAPAKMGGFGRFLLPATRWAPAQTPVVIKGWYLGSEKN